MSKILQEADGNLSFEILINGTEIKDFVEVNEIYVQQEINTISSARITLEDGGAIGVVNAPFSNSEGKDFLPGNDIEIKLGYDNDRDTVFKGVIVTQRLIAKSGRSVLQINCKDKAVNMTNGRHNAYFQHSKDSEALQSVAGKYGLKSHIDDTENDNLILMQYNCTDWDFALRRAEMNNMYVLTDKNELFIKSYDFSATPEYEINSALYVIDIDLRLESEQLVDNVELSAWDPRKQKDNKVKVNISDDLSQGNVSANKLQGAFLQDTVKHYSSASLSGEELQSWGNAIANRVILSKIRGTIAVPGTALLKAANLIKLSEFSSRFNGNAFVSKVEHELKEGAWTTTVHIGGQEQGRSALNEVEEMPASGLLPAAIGIQIGKVKKIEEDPDRDYRVLITLPAFSGQGQMEGIWARLASAYAGEKRGFFFFPEIGDEVLVSFINNDPRYPVILGSVYSAKNKPEEDPDARNQFKTIKTRSGIQLRFDDEDKVLEIETPAGNSVVLNEKNKSVAMGDMNGNTLVMNDSGITMDSTKDINLSAKGGINFKASSGVSIRGASDVKVEGGNIELKAKAGFTAKGNATAEVSASGQTTIKGAMVMIN